jgi:signal transduction histidine kinase
MSSRRKARIAFAVAISLLLACAPVVYGTLRGFAKSERLVEHTQQVQVVLGETESAIASAARARLTYIFNGDAEAFAQYQHAVSRIPTELAELRQSTKDDPAQQSHCDRLEQLVNDRIQLWEKSVALKKSGSPSPPGQPDLTRQSVAFADEIISVTQAMRTEESHLLEARRRSARIRFLFAVIILRTSFITAVLLLFWQYRLLREELRAREQAELATRQAARAATEAEAKARESENAAIASNVAARHLSARLLHLQDEERRRLSRDLHDSTGQYLAAAKMVLSSLSAGHEDDRRYSECIDLLDRSLKEIRTISHLLHPSGLEEGGFSTAAKWYSEEFAKRSSIQLKLDISDLVERLPREIEIALFRVLQESLTNIHRHSRSNSAEIIFKAAPRQATLTIQDHGIGIGKELLERFKSSGASGIGLAGMRERIRELGGNFEMESSDRGTCVRVTVPVSGRQAFAARE